ncbi:antibiotic biosynthesis monooxygenase [Tistrella mobilis]|uniref:antibiotic biosynthesis monooxygenase n=1 Tax=Tistrella mobilis TaxID=171437 RepID=UPI003555C234
MFPVSQTAFSAPPRATIFIVNVIHVYEGKLDEAFQIIQDIVHYVSQRKRDFLWSSIAKSTDGKTIVNVEAISSVDAVEHFFSDSIFAAKFAKLKKVSQFEFHTYHVDDLVFPNLDGAGS